MQYSCIFHRGNAVLGEGNGNESPTRILESVQFTYVIY